MNIPQLLRDLAIPGSLVRQGLELLTTPSSVTGMPRAVIEDGRVALAQTYYAERKIARNLRRLLEHAKESLDIPASAFEGFLPDAVQTAALNTITESMVTVLTGGPGTGKTTLVRAVIATAVANGVKIVCATPTGKAAIRVTEQTGYAATTIHRLLGWNQGKWGHNRENPVQAGLVILDETSMVDISLGAAVLDAVPDGARLLLVGDVDQLPSIGPGRLLYDLIESGIVPTVRLTKIYRQASESRIPWVAREVNNGQVPDLALTGTDFRFLHCESDDPSVELIVRMVIEGIPGQKGIPARDVQVLAAQRSKTLGIENLNRLLQHCMNPATVAETDVPIGSNYVCRTGDRVIHTENDYELGVMNGEQGWVTDACPHGLDEQEIDDHRPAATVELEDDDGKITPVASRTRTVGKKHVLLVDFGTPEAPRIIPYTKQQARSLDLSYAITIHKAQGSQFRAVVLAAPLAHAHMLTRQLLYTGITRAEAYVLCIGETRAIEKAVRNTRGSERRTALQRFLTDQGVGAPVARTLSYELPRL